MARCDAELRQRAAERQRKRREKLKADTRLHDEFKAAERERWHRRVASKKVKLIAP
jgi:hypothetical protein